MIIESEAPGSLELIAGVSKGLRAGSALCIGRTLATHRAEGLDGLEPLSVWTTPAGTPKREQKNAAPSEFRCCAGQLPLKGAVPTEASPPGHVLGSQFCTKATAVIPHGLRNLQSFSFA